MAANNVALSCAESDTGCVCLAPIRNTSLELIVVASVYRVMNSMRMGRNRRVWRKFYFYTQKFN